MDGHKVRIKINEKKYNKCNNSAQWMEGTITCVYVLF